MGVDLHVKDVSSLRSESFTVAGMTTWKRCWLPGAAELGLKIVPNLSGGYYVWFPPDEIPDLVQELKRLRSWFETNDAAHCIDQLDHVVTVLTQPYAAAFEFGFG